MKTPLLSIVIPTLNEEKCLPNLLQDLGKQYEKNFEVIVVDGHSEDNTKKVADIFKKQLPLRFLYADKRNIAFQRNLAAAKAKGEYLVFLDADCEVHPSFTKRLSTAIIRRGGVLFLPSLIPDSNTPKNKLIFAIINAVIEASQSIGKPLPTASAMFMKKDFFTRLHGYDENAYITEDIDFILRAKKSGVKAKCLKDVKVIFNMRRARKEGEVTLLSKYFTTAMLMFVNGKVKEGVFDYEMGGHVFASNERKFQSMR